jgi:hypothetical protein
VLGDGDARDERLPLGEDVGDGVAARLVRRQSRRERGGAVPQTDDAVAVDEEDAVADRVEHVRRLLALGGDRARRGLGRLELTLLRLQACVAHCRRHLADEAVDELEVLARVLGTIGHHLHDADDATLVLHGNHHRRLAPGRT